MAASISSVITMGFGAPGSASLVITDGYGQAAAAPVVTATTTAGVGRRHRFLRRAPRLPWERDEQIETVQDVVVAKPKRKRISMPAAAEIRSEIGPIPLQAVTEVIAPAITVPDLGKAALDDDDDEDLMLWLI